MTSDAFFAFLPEELKYDLIFIDGLHVYEQDEKDLNNALKHLSENGTIMLHDCNPPTEWHQRSYEEALENGCRLWNGTVWKAYVKTRATNPDLEMYVVDTDWGCGIVKHGKQSLIDGAELSYANLEKNRQSWLNLISVDDFFAKNPVQK